MHIKTKNEPIKSTLYQIALQEKNYFMCETIEPYFDKLFNGRQAALKQFNDLFPESKSPSEDILYDFQPLFNELISKDRYTSSHDELNKFKHYFNPVNMIDRKESVFQENLKNAKEIYAQYEKGLNNYEMRGYIWKEVIDYLEYSFHLAKIKHRLIANSQSLIKTEQYLFLNSR